MILLLQSFDYWYVPLIKRKSMILHLSYTCHLMLTIIQVQHYFHPFLYLLLHTSPILSYLQSYLSFIYTLQFFGSCYFYYRFFNLLLFFPCSFQAVLLCPYGDPKCVYPFGADPVWKISANELLFFNSMKMKMFVHVHLIHSFRFVVFLFSFLSALTISSNLTLFFISFSHFCSLHQVGHPWHFTDDFWSLSEGHQRPLLPLLPWLFLRISSYDHLCCWFLRLYGYPNLRKGMFENSDNEDYWK